jgi:anti-anti-sigma factor
MIYKKVKIEGNLVFMNPFAKQQIKESMDKKYIEIDMTNVESIDSSGIDLIVRLIHSSKKQNGCIKIIGTRPHIKDLLEVCGLDKIMEII